MPRKTKDEKRRKQLFRQVAAGYRALQKNPVAWAEFLEERAAWDPTLMDGLR